MNSAAKRAFPATISTCSPVEMVEFYWLAAVDLQNAIEDVAGADGRREYLSALRFRIIDILQRMDCFAGRALTVSTQHRLASALEDGITFLGWDGEDLRRRFLLVDAEPTVSELRDGLLSVCEAVVASIPGQLPDAQGTRGQAEMLRAMREWSKFSAPCGHDLGFLAERLKDL